MSHRMTREARHHRQARTFSKRSSGAARPARRYSRALPLSFLFLPAPSRFAALPALALQHDCGVGTRRVEAKVHTKGAELTQQDELGAETLQAGLP